jgi:hypothetical protein
MKLTAIVTRATRNIHDLAVRLHGASLRFTVRVAEAQARTASRIAHDASEAASIARSLEARADRLASNAASHLVLVRTAAEAEARVYGATL